MSYWEKRRKERGIKPECFGTKQYNSKSGICRKCKVRLSYGLRRRR